MRSAAPAALFLLLVAAACGKVGDPKPPIVRTPAPVGDLRVIQSGHNVVLTWTNPALYIDNNPVTDLAVAHIFRNGVEIAAEPVTAPGQPQSFSLDVANSLDTDLEFAVRLETQRGRFAMSNSSAIRAVEVPGVPQNVRAVFDQYQIRLTWEPPERNPSLVEAYVVQRADPPTSALVRTTRFEDPLQEDGKKYTYTVTAARNPDGTVPGPASMPVDVTATDEVAPAMPAGLQIEPLGAGVFLKWNRNTERDLKEYLIFRSDRAAPIHTPVESYTDVEYSPGVSYQIAAIDFSENQSERTAPQAGP